MADIEPLRSRVELLMAIHRSLRANIRESGKRLQKTVYAIRSTTDVHRALLPAAPGIPADAPPTEHPLKDLTPREIEVLRFVAEGHTTRETAARLGITFKTAACHRFRVMQKLGVHENSSLVRIAIRTNLIGT